MPGRKSKEADRMYNTNYVREMRLRKKYFKVLAEYKQAGVAYSLTFQQFKIEYNGIRR